MTTDASYDVHDSLLMNLPPPLTRTSSQSSAETVYPNIVTANGTTKPSVKFSMSGGNLDYKIPIADSSTSSLTALASDAPDLANVPAAGPAPGTASEEVYVRTLSWWRAGARRMVMRNLHAESRWIAEMQSRLRTPWLDTYFVYTSTLGTHTFFMTALPALFFFGYQEAGRGLIFVLAMGVYVSSFLKDLVCAPRPYSPPVTRLTMGSHHLEYGFPSTHSTNSVSIALYIYSFIHALYFNPSETAISTQAYVLSCLFLAIYIVSIVFGRLYTGMHSLTDCAVGIFLGISVWALHAQLWAPVEAWIVAAHISPSASVPVALAWLPTAWAAVIRLWTGPVVVAALTGVMVHRHPQPADDCPCFEDAIAFVSVVAGMLVSRWAAVRLGFDDDVVFSTRMRGTPWPAASHSPWAEAGLWYAFALLKLTLGILAIFVWRLVAKAALRPLLPAAFRALARLLPRGVQLPNRRFYTPATEYDGAVPTERGLHPIPSVIDLPGSFGVQGDGFEDDGAEGMRFRGRTAAFDDEEEARADEKLGRVEWKGYGTVYGVSAVPGHAMRDPLNEKGRADEDAEDDEVKHYDADVLTKVFVYAGIATLATEVMPVIFSTLGWGMRP